jgi:hypothetical protein
LGEKFELSTTVKRCTQWYSEVAILKVEEATAQAEQLFYATSRPGWWESKQGVFWVRKPYSHRLSSTGDVIVSVLSQTAWLVCDRGFEVIEPAEGEVKG